ncbi:carbon-nitrogen hydrolase family protein [Acinetobacter rathckeae]|uniref:carbon-nitrogen hydrolase family protein n=1 Tax=Acinetobacter rathckeae TaxID=2605272 RepID=UPI001BB43081|nr:carbon-nitrogen hydrolase family protein [Acinetobacter rathckeae]
MIKLPVTKVAAAHVAPIYMNKAATVQKALSIIDEAAKNGAELVVFPESFIPGFPVWAALWAPIYNHDWFKIMVENSLLVNGPEICAIRAAAKRHGVFISLGFSEATEVSVGCIWNSNIIIGDDGEVLNHHRKLVPTFYEKMVWAAGDGKGLQVVDTKIGKIGALICGENTNPLAKYSLAAQGEQIHISAWPAIWPTRKPGVQNFNNLEANRIRASSHCFEAKVFGIISAGFMDQTMIDCLSKNADQDAIDVLLNTPRAATQFITPTSEVIGDTLQNEEGIAYATFDLNTCVEPKQYHDIVGYYNRYDVFDLTVTRQRDTPAKFIDDTSKVDFAPLDSTLLND